MAMQQLYRPRCQNLTPTAWESKQEIGRLGVKWWKAFLTLNNLPSTETEVFLEVLKISACVNDTETGFFRAIQNFQK